MATNTYVALDKVTISGSSTNSFTFSSIPQTGYTDLVLVATIYGNSSNDELGLRLNSDTGSSNKYSRTAFYADGTTVASSRNTTASPVYEMRVGTYGTTQQICTLNFFNYTNTSMYKTVLGIGGGAGSQVMNTCNLWKDTSAISSITVRNSSGANFTSGSTFSLYGITAEGISPAPKATGGTVYSDSLYYYHVFGSTGVFTPASSLTADVMVIAGGGGGGTDDGGGGGAGNIAYQESRSLSATGYTCTVGAGGLRGNSSGITGFSGSPSTLDGITAVGGGGGGTGNETTGNGVNGGSGGGSGYKSLIGGTGTTSTSSGATRYGNSGGSSVNASPYPCGGGGGAGTAGSNGVSITAGAGGNGSNLFTTWTTATGLGVNGYIAAGGGGSVTTGGIPASGGLGGGGNGCFASINATDGLIYSGSGGGGGLNFSGSTGLAGNGGSGAIVIRYLKA